MIEPIYLKKVAGDYAIASQSAVKDPVLLSVAQQYETNIGRKIFAIQPKEIATKFPGEESVLASTKYDGEGVFIYFEKNEDPTPEKPEIFAFNAYSGRVRVGLPALKALQERLKAAGLNRALLRAELYLPGTANGRRHSTADVTRVSFNGSSDEVAQLTLAILSIIMLDSKDWQVFQNRFEMVWNEMETLAGTDPKQGFHRADGAIIPESQVEAQFKKIVAAGGEGAVIRRLTRAEAFKIKPKLTIDAAVIGYVEGEWEGFYGVRSLLVALTYGETGHNTHFHVFGRIYSKMDDQTAQKLLPVLQARKTELPLTAAGAPLTMTDSDNRVIHFVKPGLIVQVEGDEIVHSKHDQPNEAQLFAWENGSWKFLKVSAVPRLSFPTFGGFREDKTLEAGGARIEQVLSSPKLDTTIQTESEPKVLLRRVWTKAFKGQTSLRKLLVVDTGGGNHRFRYAIAWVDYSPTRAKPFDNDVKFAHTATRRDQLVALLTAEMETPAASPDLKPTTKKGWTEVLLNTQAA